MNLLKKIFASTLFKLSSFNLLNIITRIFTGFFASKILAIFIGPSGLAIMGSFRNFLTSLDSFSTIGIQNGIIKYTAQYDSQREKLNQVLSTVFITIGFAVIICILVIVLPAPYISSIVFNGDVTFAWLFRLLGFVLPLYTGSLLFMAVLNGLGNYNKVILFNIITNIAGVGISALLIWQFGVNGALSGLIISPVLLFIMSFYPLYRYTENFSFIKYRYFSFQILKGLISYSFMTLFTAIVTPFVYISLRDKIINTAGENEAGYWEAISRISLFYLMFATTLLTVYFLPQLSKSKTLTNTRKIFLSYYKVMIPAFGAGLFLIYILRFVIIKLIFTTEFYPVQKLFLWQLIGDFFKVCSLILGNEFFAKRMTKNYLITEFISFCVLYISGSLLIPIYASEGAVMAHCITYVIYFILLSIIFRKKLF